MTPFKKYTSIIIWTVFISYFGYKFIDYLYYSSFKGDDHTQFIKIDTAGVKTYGDIFKSELFRNKVTLVNVSFYADNVDHQEDLPYFKRLYEKYKGKPFQILYTNAGFDDRLREANHKKIIKQNQTYGLHSFLPYPIINTMCIISDDNKTWTYPQYLLVDKNGKIDTFAPRPAKYQLLSQRIESLLNK